MSALAARLEEVRNAAAIAKKLSPAMARAITAPSVSESEPQAREYVVANESEVGSLTLYTKMNTLNALLTRGLLGGHRFPDDLNVLGKDFTDLGLLVRDVLVRGADVLLAEETYSERSTEDLNSTLRYNTVSDVQRKVILNLLHERALEEHAERCTGELDGARIEVPAAAEQPDEGQGPPVADWPRSDALPLGRDVGRHEVLAGVAARMYFEKYGQAYFASPQRHTSALEEVVLVELQRAGWIELRAKAIAALPATFGLTDAGARALMVWDGAYTRNDFPEKPIRAVGSVVNPLAVGVPPREVIVAMPTKRVVRKYSDYYIFGPGRLFAQRVSCEHDYRLTDSCPCC